MRAGGAGPVGADVGKEVVALVIHQDVGGEILHRNFPDSLHTQFRVFDALDGSDAVLGQVSCYTADGAQVEPTELLAGIGDALGAVALGNHNHAAAVALEELHIGIHAPGCGGTERAGGVALGGLGGAGVVDGVVFDVLRQFLAGIDEFLELGVGDIAAHNDGAGEGKTGLDRVFGQLGQHFLHGAVQVNRYSFALGFAVLGGDILARVVFQLFDEDTLGGNLGLGVAVG